MYSFSTPSPITVEVRNASGDIHVTLTETEQTTVEVTLTAGGALGFVDEIVRAFGGRRTDSDPARDGEQRDSRWWEQPRGAEASEILDRVRVEIARHDDGDTLIVDTDPASRGWRTAFSIAVTAPAGSGVRVVSQSADTTVVGRSSRLDIKSASGDVAAGDVTGGARVHTASGDIRLASVGGAVSCKSASGDVTIGRAGGDGTLHTTSGRVQVEAATGEIEVRTVSGDIRVADLAGGAMTVTAVSGDVELGVHPGVLAAVSLASVSGETRSDLEITDAPASRPDDAQVGGPASAADDADRAGSPGGSDGGGSDGGPDGGTATATLRITVRTTSGDIRLRRSPAVVVR